MIEDDGNVGPETSGEVNVEVAHVADHDGVRGTFAARPPPETGPGGQHAGPQERKQPGLLENPDAPGSLESQGSVALGHLVTVGSHPLGENEHSWMARGVICSEEENSHAGAD